MTTTTTTACRHAISTEYVCLYPLLTHVLRCPPTAHIESRPVFAADLSRTGYYGFPLSSVCLAPCHENLESERSITVENECEIFLACFDISCPSITSASPRPSLHIAFYLDMVQTSGLQPPLQSCNASPLTFTSYVYT